MTMSQTFAITELSATSARPPRPLCFISDLKSPISNLQSLAIPRRLNTYKKRARNSPEMNTYKIIRLKPPLESTLTKKRAGGGHPTRDSHPESAWADEGSLRACRESLVAALTVPGSAAILEYDTYIHAPNLL